MSELVQVPLHITRQQAHKLKNAQPIQLSKKQLTSDHNIVLHLHQHHAKKIHMAKKNRKGVRIHLSEHEHHVNGSGILDWLKGAWNTIKDTGSKIINSDAYQSIAKPVVKDLVQAGVNLIPVSGTAKDVLQNGVNYLGNESHAFGLRQKKSKKKKQTKYAHLENEHDYDEQEYFGNPKAPTPGQPGFVSIPNIGGAIKATHIIHHHVMHSGGSFRLS